MEIDVESDDVLSNEEIKHDEPILQDEFYTMPTKILSKKAQMILNTIHERLMAKDVSLRRKLTAVVRDPKVTKEFHTRPVYCSHGGNHLSMARVLDFQHVGTSQSGKMMSNF